MSRVVSVRGPETFAGNGNGSPTDELPFRPVKLWAIIGAAFLALEAYALTGWLTSGKATPTPAGGSPLPGYMAIAIRVWEIAALPALFVFLWFFLIKPWRRDGRIGTDGLFCLVFATIWWQDPMANFIAPYFTYNAHLVNYGNWLNNIPGWVMPGAHKIAEAPLWTFPLYVYVVFGFCMVGGVVLRKAKQRWPQLTKPQLAGLLFGCFFAFTTVLEPVLMVLGFWTYTGVVKELTLFHGHYYQFPLYESLLFSGAWTAWACLRHFRNDKGQTIVERGTDNLMLGPKGKTVVRFLALAGACNAILLIGYNIPMQLFVLNADPIVKDQLQRSYFMNGICGHGTDYACYGPDVPFPRRGSAYVGNDGELKNPRGATFTAPPHER